MKYASLNSDPYISKHFKIHFNSLRSCFGLGCYDDFSLRFQNLNNYTCHTTWIYEVSMTFEKNIFKAKALHCKNATLINTIIIAYVWCICLFFMTFHMKSIIFETEKTLYRWYIMLISECLCIIYDTIWNFITFLKRMKIFETEKTLYLWYIMHWRHLLVFQWYNAMIYENCLDFYDVSKENQIP